MKAPWNHPLLRTPVATQVRREFWEHRNLWLVPLATAAILLIGSMIAGTHMRGPVVLMGAGRPMVVYGTAMAFASFLAMITSIIVFFYLLDCLYAERKDRSILFWKSLPVSDAQTVLVKFATGLVVVPAGALLLSMVTHLLGTAVMALRGVDFGGGNGSFSAAQAWGAAHLRLLGGLVVAMLWYAPIAAYLMLASVVSRRAPFVTAALPIAVPILLEKMFFSTSYVAQFVAYRLSPWGARGKWPLGPDDSFLGPLSSPHLWLGLVAAAGMLYMVIRLRRYRDDT